MLDKKLSINGNNNIQANGDVNFYAAPDASVNHPEEVQSIMELIEHLSAQSSGKAMPIEKPDPKHKIYTRFSEHSKYLEGELLKYLPYYQEAKDVAERVVGFDEIKSRRIAAYLRHISNKFLEENNNNPKDALNKLTDSICKQFEGTKKPHSWEAIRYYLVYQLKECNVFPNPE